MATPSTPPAPVHPRLGLGGGALGALGDAGAFRLLDAAVDLDVALVDLARSYGDAEACVGRWRRHGRRQLPIFTKGGYGVDGVDDWTSAAIVGGVEAACRRLGTERLDGFLLHSCPADVLRSDEVRRGLEAIRPLVQHLGYAGDNHDLHIAIDDAWDVGFDTFMCSLSILDGKQRVMALPRLRSRGAKVIAKRALANAPWRVNDATAGDVANDVAWQRRRFQAAQLPDTGLSWETLFVRWAAFGTGHNDGADVVLIGTASPARLALAAEALRAGPLPTDIIDALQPALARCDDDSPI